MPQSKPMEQGTWRRGAINPPDAPIITHLVVDGYGFGDAFYQTACDAVQEFATTVRDETPENRCGACKVQEPIYKTVWEQPW